MENGVNSFEDYVIKGNHFLIFANTYRAFFLWKEVCYNSFKWEKGFSGLLNSELFFLEHESLEKLSEDMLENHKTVVHTEWL